MLDAMMKFAIQALTAVLAVLGIGLTLAPAEDLPPLKTGDIVFQKTTSSASDAIMLASGTEYTHVGIVDVDKNGRSRVIEAVGPVQEVPLDAWIKKGVGSRVTVKRIKGLDEANAKEAIASARRYLGRPYDHFFYETRDQIYCSELVYAAFQDGPGLTVGHEEKVRDLNIDTAAAQKLNEILAAHGAGAIPWAKNTWHAYHNWEHLHAGATVVKSGWPFKRPEGDLSYRPDALPRTREILSRCLSWQIMLNWDQAKLQQMTQAVNAAAVEM